MRRLKILYFHWGEITARDCTEAMRRQGHEVTIISKEIKDYDFDEELVALFLDYFKRDIYDCVFSFNYIPLISWLCQELKTKYISWVYDSPHLTLSSLSINNCCNDIFLFDKGLCRRMQGEGATQVRYMPLPYNKRRIDNLVGKSRNGYAHHVTFLGSLYNDENNYYDQITYLPEDTKRYIEDLIAKQQLDFSVDLFEEGVDHKLCTELMEYIKFNLGPYYKGYQDEVIRNMFRKKVTVIERPGLLKKISDEYPVDLYSGKKPDDIQVNYLGFADYYSEMPLIFSSSRINLNITVRYNISGLPLRVIDILGAGGFLLSSYQGEMEEYFMDGKSICWFKSPDEMMEKVRYYMVNEREREQIAEEGKRIASRVFDYDVLLPKVLSGVC